jgi:hypothetical protein
METNIVTGDVSPSAALIGASRQPVVVTDALGRKITIRKLSLLDNLRLMEGMGPALAGNRPYMAHVEYLASVVSIDGSAEPIMTTKIQVEALAQRLDNDGLDAVVEGYNKNFAKQESGDPGEIKK